MAAFFASLWAKAQLYLAVAGAVLLAIGIAFLKGRAAGKAVVADTITRQTQKINEKFRDIDSQRPDFDGALGRLRDRSNKG